MELYGDPSSGNVWKVQYILERLGIPYSHDPVGWSDGGTQTEAFKRINPNARVPAIDDDGFILWESGAILCYLTEGTSWFPSAAQARALVLQWMFFEQYSHEPYIAVSRWIMHNVPPGPDRDRRLNEKRAGCHHALAVMEQHLAKRDWFVGEEPTLADLVLVAYTHVAGEAGIDPAAYPSVQAWVARFQRLPGWMALPSAPIPPRAAGRSAQLAVDTASSRSRIARR